MSKLYTIDEAASYIGLTKQTLRNWEKSGKIDCVREPQSNYRLFPEEELNRVRPTTKPKKVKQTAPPKKRNDIRLKTDSDVKRFISRAHRIIRDNDGRSSIIERFDELTKLIIVYLSLDEGINTELRKVDEFAHEIKSKYSLTNHLLLLECQKINYKHL